MGVPYGSTRLKSVRSAAAVAAASAAAEVTAEAEAVVAVAVVAAVVVVVAAAAIGAIAGSARPLLARAGDMIVPGARGAFSIAERGQSTGAAEETSAHEVAQ